MITSGWQWLLAVASDHPQTSVIDHLLVLSGLWFLGGVFSERPCNTRDLHIPTDDLSVTIHPQDGQSSGFDNPHCLCGYLIDLPFEVSALLHDSESTTFGSPHLSPAIPTHTHIHTYNHTSIYTRTYTHVYAQTPRRSVQYQRVEETLTHTF